MLKKKHLTVYSDFKTGFLSKISLIFGLILLCIFFVLKLISIFINNESSGFIKSIYIFSQSNIVGSIIAISILFLSIGIILYFFHRQFEKLAKIANEIENEFKK